VSVVDVLNPDVVFLLETRGHNVGLDSLEIDVGNLSLITVEDLSNLFKSGALGLDIKDGDEDELEKDPALADVSVSFSIVNLSVLTA
jgi:hypothetical protein